MIGQFLSAATFSSERVDPAVRCAFSHVLTDRIGLAYNIAAEWVTDENKHTLVFTPDEHLDPATEYTVVVRLDKIYKDMPKDYEDYVFQFKTITPNFNIVTNAVKSWHLRGSLTISLSL